MDVKKTEGQSEVQIEIGEKSLNGFLHLPVNTKSLVIFAHGSGSSRFSVRNQLVARFLTDQSIGTLLFDLLTAREGEIDDKTREFRFNIPFLAERLIAATEWIQNYEQTKQLNLGYFGASTGAAAALIAAAELQTIGAVVSRGGRPDLAGHALAKVGCPTLFIVGSEDHGVIELNQHALSLLNCPKKMTIIEGAGHLFEETGTLEETGRLAALWFSSYL